MPPIAIAAASPTARVSVATARITNIKMNAQHELPEERLRFRPGRQRRADVRDVAERGAQQQRGRESPRRAGPPSSRQRAATGSGGVSANASVTAALKWAPEMWPTA